MNELSQAISELRECGKALMTIANNLQDIFSTPAETEAPEACAPEVQTKAAEPETQVLTFIEVRKLLSKKSRAGHTAEVKALLQRYGADKLSELAESNCAAVAAEAEVL